MKQTIRSFFAYRLASTYWQFGIKIQNIVDTLQFARSHHSHLVQLADAYVFIVSHLYTTSRKGWTAEKLRRSLVQKFMPIAHKMVNGHQGCTAKLIILSVAPRFRRRSQARHQSA
jgi:hypothetical protein